MTLNRRQNADEDAEVGGRDGVVKLAARLDHGRNEPVHQLEAAIGEKHGVAASVAPIGAIVGEWVGSSAGLGYLMLHANARLQVDLMFAALLVLAVFAVCLYFAIDRSLRRLISWQADKAL